MPVKKEKLPDGREINTSERFEIGRNLCNKLWNAARLVLMGLDEGYTPQPIEFGQLPLEDRWILSRLNVCIEQVTAAMEGYLFAESVSGVYRFFWNEFCDWYLEWIKPRLRTASDTQRQAQQVSAFCLDQILRLMHPAMPFITEKLWSELNHRCPKRGVDQLFTADAPLVVSPWPKARGEWTDTTPVDDMDQLQQVIRALRDIRANINRSRASNKQSSINSLPLAHLRCSEHQATMIDAMKDILCQLANLDRLVVNPPEFTTAGCAARVIPNPDGIAVELAVPVGELIDIDHERKRLQQELSQLTQHIKSSEARLANDNFTAKAPPPVVEEHRQRLAEMQSKHAALTQSLAELHG
jgi:valyl-tRNA synthetase